MELQLAGVSTRPTYNVAVDRFLPDVSCFHGGSEPKHRLILGPRYGKFTLGKGRSRGT